jgi:hypothetical protein
MDNSMENVTPFQQPDVTDEEVSEAAAALDANSSRAFDDGETLDGTNGFGETSDSVVDDDEPEVQTIANDNLPEVPAPNDEINQFIMDCKQEMDEINKKRDSLNAEASVIREKLKAKGIDTATFIYQCRVMDLDEDKRARIDRTSALVRAAGCKPIQNDLFIGDEE